MEKLILVLLMIFWTKKLFKIFNCLTLQSLRTNLIYGGKDKGRMIWRQDVCYLLFKMDCKKDLLYSTGAHQCYVAAWTRGGSCGEMSQYIWKIMLSRNYLALI